MPGRQLGSPAVALGRVRSALQLTCSRGVGGGIIILYVLPCVGMNIQRQPATFEVIPEICDGVSDRESDFVEVLGVECLLHSNTVMLARTSVDVWSGMNRSVVPMQLVWDCFEYRIRTTKFGACFTVLVFEQFKSDEAVQL